MDITFMDEVYTFSWSSDQVDESESTRILRFRLMPGENVRSFRSKSKMGKSNEISTVRFLQRLIWSWWKADCVRVEYFPTTYVIGNPPKESRKICKFKTLSLRYLEIESSSCRFSMTMNGQRKEIQNNVFQIPNTSRITRRDSRKGTGRSLDLVVNWNCMELKVNFLKENGNPLLTRWWNDSRKLDIQYSRSLVPWLVEIWKEGWRRNHTLHCGCFDHRALISNDSLSKSAQYVRSSCLLMWRVWSDALWNFRKAYEDRTWSSIERSETARSAFFGSNSKARWSRIWKQPARKHSELWDTRERNPIYESLCECDIHPSSFCGKVLHRCRCGWSFWRSNSSMQRVHTLVQTRMRKNVLLFENE